MLFVTISTGRMKIYAELHGDMQKPRKKSRGGNKLDTCATMAKSINSAVKAISMPSVSDLVCQALPEYETIGSTAIETLKVGDRPYRVNSVNISLRRH